MTIGPELPPEPIVIKYDTIGMGGAEFLTTLAAAFVIGVLGALILWACVQ